MARKRKSTKEPTLRQLSLQTANLLLKKKILADIEAIKRTHRIHSLLLSGKPIQYLTDQTNWPTGFRVPDSQNGTTT
jgi:hypothetical protein